MAKTTPFDAAEYLTSPEIIEAYLNDAFESGSPQEIALAIGAVARAKGMSAVAREAELNRENLYKALSNDGKPEFLTIVKVLDTLGYRLHATPKAAQEHRASA